MKLAVICSVTPSLLLALKQAHRGGYLKIPTLAVVHGCLAGVLTGRPRRPWNRILDIHRAMAARTPVNLRLVALGESIYAMISRLQPQSADQWVALDLPCIWEEQESSSSPLPPTGNLHFGFLGVSSKGFDRFARIAASVTRKFPAAEFYLVGHVNDRCREKIGTALIRGASKEPLSWAEYIARARRLHYTVWTGDPMHYSLTASASFLDSLSFLKPGIFLRCPYIEHYFSILGDIGYLCNDTDEIESVISSIIRDRPIQRYEQQRRTIASGRSIFEPTQLSATLGRIVDRLLQS